MKTRFVAYLLIALGAVVLLAQWSVVTDRLVHREGADRPKEVTIWSSSGDPSLTRRIAQDFMEENPDVNMSLHFRESGSMGEVIFVSFLSGNPPDVMDIPINQIRDYIADGMVRPIDDLLKRELERNPDYLEMRLGRESEIFRWQTNPNDYYIRNRDRYPEQAARLINMHNRVIGFTQVGFPRMMTFNRRIFQEAAEVFPDAGLVDEEGEPVPPATWSELVRVAKVITDYGKTLDEEENRPYGVILQGRQPRDIMRGITPLAAVAGSIGFNFEGKDWVSSLDQKAGFYEYDSPAFLGALALILRLQEDGSILPGTAGRHFEEPRTLIGEGRAAILIEDWHAALRAAITVPINRRDIGSAPIPVPDEAFAEEVGLELGRGTNPAPMGQGITVITSGASHPEAVWRWLHHGLSVDQQKRRMEMNLTLPVTWEAAERILSAETEEDKKWAQENLLPFQRMAWEVFEESAIWPTPPVHGPVRVDNPETVLHRAFLDFQRQSDLSVEETLAKAREGLERFTQAVNEDLEQRIRSGVHDPGNFTFPEWDQENPTPFFLQQRAYRPEGADEQIALSREDLPEEFKDLTYGFIRSPGWPHLAGILLLILLTILAFLGWKAWKDWRGGNPLLGTTRKESREQWYAYLFVFPAIISLFAFILYPSLYQFYLALHSGTGLGILQSVGFEHFRTILFFEDTRFWTEVVPNTFRYMLMVAAGEVLIGLALALVLVLPFRANRLYRTLFFIPLVTSLAAISIIFFGLLAGTDSTVNQILFHLDGFWERFTGYSLYPEDSARDFLNDPALALYTVIGVAIWSGIPFNTILCMAGLQSISPDLYEAAKVDGAGPWRRFIYITIPQMLPILVIIIFNSLVGAARHFGTVYIMTEGEHGTEIASTYIFKWGFVRTDTQIPDVGYASALGLVYALLLGVFIVFNVWFIAQRWKKRLAPAEPEKKEGNK
ncbi:MAG: extracellular solute-binding protein [Opitutales bacterium]|nr:extracellular solute-binding protein [Opitutales bacterium]